MAKDGTLCGKNLLENYNHAVLATDEARGGMLRMDMTPGRHIVNTVYLTADLSPAKPHNSTDRYVN